MMLLSLISKCLSPARVRLWAAATMVLIGCGIACSSAAGAGEVRTLTTDGAWTWFNDPRSFYRDGALYTGWIKRNGDVEVSRFDTSTKLTTDTEVVHAAYQRDDHNNPGLLPNADGSFTAFYTQHATSVPLQYRNVTVNANGTLSPSTLETTLPGTDIAGTSGWTYANPYRLSNDVPNGGGASKSNTYLFSRGPNFNPVYRVRDDASNTWGAAKTLISNTTQRPYVKYGSNNTTRAYFAFTDAHPRNVDNNIYFAYLEGGAYYRANGSKIRDMSSGPITLADVQISTGANASGTVWNHTTHAPIAGIPSQGDNSWIWDVSTDSTGAPVVAFSTFPTDNDHQYHWARWNGSQWIDRVLVNDAGGSIALAGEGHYSGGLTLDPTNPNIVYLSRQDTGGNWDLEQWKTSNAGLSWSTLNIAEGAGAALENVRPYVPLNRPANTEMVLWLAGQYDYWNFGTGGALANSVGYDTDVKLWINAVPEPASLSLLGLLGLMCLRPQRTMRRGVKSATASHPGRSD